MSDVETFWRARDFLLERAGVPDAAYGEFRWPKLERFNWASDHFDALVSCDATPALHILSDREPPETYSFKQLSRKSNQAASYLTRCGIGRGDSILVMLGNVVELWIALLAAMKIGAVIVPTTPLLNESELRDRLSRARVKGIIAESAAAARFPAETESLMRLSVGSPPRGWRAFSDYADESERNDRWCDTRADDPLLLYFTSGTTTLPKMVLHTHASYPVGHLSTMYWLGLRRGDWHLNLSSPGWAKHAWSCVFAPWNAEACVVAYRYERFDPAAFLRHIAATPVTSLCAPPTVWRSLVQQDLAAVRHVLRTVTSAGEPLNREVIDRVRIAWGLTVRDGYGQTETTAQIGNVEGSPFEAGSMGRPLPGYRIALLDDSENESDAGEVSVDLRSQPVGVMAGYVEDDRVSRNAISGAYYRTGDLAERDSDGVLTFVGRVDDVFKSSGYRISPFEIESVLLEHPAVLEAAVVACPDDARGTIPKAFVSLAGGHAPDFETARSIFAHVNQRVSPHKRVRRIEFAHLPKTISGKIRRGELRKRELAAHCSDQPRNDFVLSK